MAPGSGTDVSAITLTPQEVLQELLGDLFIPPGRLEIGEQLGQGGFADVHKARGCYHGCHHSYKVLLLLLASIRPAHSLQMQRLRSPDHPPAGGADRPADQ